MIEAGTRLGPYEVVQPLGAGGMGEVYKARDTRLDRIVAIKVLPPHLSDNPENRERFEREARAISGLNHPNICTLHDVGRQGDIDFLVMEYLEGETLAARLEKGALPLDQALVLSIQIADALDRAHRQGIVHRDLKPANVMLLGASGGRPQASRSASLHAKLLDFGLAKLGPQPHTVGSGSMVPTIMPSVDLTARGTILGTLQYMAPEQLEGLEADARTDIFAFGSLVYEMATGSKAFQGKSQPSLISAIMSADAPSISAVQSMSPPALDHLVKTCLAKDPADRWQTIHDVMAQLKWIAEGGSQVGMPAPVVAVRRPRGHVLIGALAVALLAIAALSVPAWRYLQGTPPPDAIRFTVETPRMPSPTFLAISPDGRSVAFQARSARGPAIYIRRLDSTRIDPLAGTERGAFPFWSPDSRSLGFFAGNKLRKIAIAGGAPLELAEGIGPGSWGTQGTILFARGGDLYSIPESGGEPALVELETPFPAFPHFLADGRHFLYTAGGESPGIHVAALGSKTARLLVPIQSSAVYADPGFLLFNRQGSVFAQAFDARTQALSGNPIHVVDDVFMTGVGRAALSVSQNGVLLYRPGSGTVANQQFVWFDRSGRQTGTAGKADRYAENFDLSPDGRQVAVSITDDDLGLGAKMWVMDWARGVTAPFTFEAARRDVAWSPDGLRLAYSTNSTDSGVEIFLKNSSGLGQAELLVSGPRDEWVKDWSKDGRYIAYVAGAEAGSNVPAIWAVPLFGDRKPFPVAESPFAKAEPRFSPDGKWLAYESLESGQSQIFVTSFPAADQKRQISDAGGTQPRWNKSGAELYYLSLDGKMMAVDIKTAPSLDSGIPRVLFETGLSVATAVDQYAVTGDGQRFLLLKPLTDQVEPPLTLIVNWTRLLKQ